MNLYEKETILVLGNGFDLAHDLPTSYVDFLKFAKIIQLFLEYEKKSGNDEGIFELELSKIDSNIAKMINNNMGDVRNTAKLEGNLFSQKDMWCDLLQNNFWIDHFQKAETLSDGWIDFEAEISKVINEVDNAIKKAEKNGDRLERFIEIYTLVMELKTRGQMVSKQNIVNFLFEQLIKMKRALELYLSDYVEEIDVFKRCEDILNLNPTKILSFNYTNTYKRIYGKEDTIEYDYIHGIANAKRDISNSNIVLGIDEYLDNDNKNKDLLFIEFKKYYQRLFYGCQRNAEDWCTDIKKDLEYEKAARKILYEDEISYRLLNESSVGEELLNSFNYESRLRIEEKEFANRHPKHELIIFGHSLGVTDKDILQKLILNDNVHTTIYYHSKKSYSDQIKNLVRVIGQDELNKRTGGKYRTIEFKKISDD